MADADKPGLLVPDHRVVSIDEAREEQERKKHGRPSDLLYRKDLDAAVAQLNVQMVEGIAAGLLATGERMYAQWSEESGAFLEAMELEIEQKIVARLANERRERSWRHRLGAWWRRVRGVPAPLTLDDVTDEIVEEEAPADG